MFRLAKVFLFMWKYYTGRIHKNEFAKVTYKVVGKFGRNEYHCVFYCGFNECWIYFGCKLNVYNEEWLSWGDYLCFSALIEFQTINFHMVDVIVSMK